MQWIALSNLWTTEPLVETGTVRVKCLTQEHSTLAPVSAQARTYGKVYETGVSRHNSYTYLFLLLFYIKRFKTSKHLIMDDSYKII